MKLKKTIAYQLFTYIVDNISPIVFIALVFTGLSFFLIPINPDRDFNPNTSLILGAALIFFALCVIMYRYFYIEGKKQAQINNRVNSTLYPKALVDKFDNVPFIFYMDGKRFTIEEAAEYYERQKDRGRRAFRLDVYDCAEEEFISSTTAADYFEKPTMLSDK